MSHILVIEDDAFFSEMLVQMLQQDGHKVTARDDGMQALKWLESSQPDLVITDMLMPNMDGVDFIIALSKSHSGLPIVAMSGGRRSISAAFNLESAKLLGVRATLKKPFSQGDLRQALQLGLA